MNLSVCQRTQMANRQTHKPYKHTYGQRIHTYNMYTDNMYTYTYKYNKYLTLKDIL